MLSRLMFLPFALGVLAFSCQSASEDTKANWIDRLRNGTVIERLEAIEKLAPVAGDDKAALSALIEALDDQFVSSEACKAIAKIGPKAKAAVPALCVCLRDKSSPGLRMTAALALAAMGKAAESASESLADALSDEDSCVRANAAFALDAIGPNVKPAIPALIKALEDEDSSVRNNAANALKYHVSSLIKELNVTNLKIRLNSIISLGQIGKAAKDALPALEAALKDSEVKVRDAAAIAISRIKDKE